MYFDTHAHYDDKAFDSDREELLHSLPQKGVELRQIPRLEEFGTPISASAVRKLLGQGQGEKLRAMVPETTFEYLCSHNMI